MNSGKQGKVISKGFGCVFIRCAAKLIPNMTMFLRGDFGQFHPACPAFVPVVYLYLNISVFRQRLDGSHVSLVFGGKNNVNFFICHELPEVLSPGQSLLRQFGIVHNRSIRVGPLRFFCMPDQVKFSGLAFLRASTY